MLLMTLFDDVDESGGSFNIKNRAKNRQHLLDIYPHGSLCTIFFSSFCCAETFLELTSPLPFPPLKMIMVRSERRCLVLQVFLGRLGTIRV